ncbi:hypothetical protein C8J57DRAFT_1527336 [Mycena rebaudengoi]|nr:hypothetical protein C8J57DRAFT_1527336 [Mycena rebaudengoi]
MPDETVNNFQCAKLPKAVKRPQTAPPINRHSYKYSAPLCSAHMDWFPEATIETLPDELLAEILKLGADSPLPRRNLVPPFPVAVSRISRRWRAIMLGSPGLWTTIRLSHNPITWIWASLCAKHSQPYPLDISISLESYTAHIDGRYDYEPLLQALSFVSPHMGRW